MTSYTWNFKQWIRLWPLYMILWLRIGRQIGLAVPSMNPQHWVSGAPFAWIASENASGWSQTRSKDSRRCLKRSYKSSIIWGKNESCITLKDNYQTNSYGTGQNELIPHSFTLENIRLSSELLLPKTSTRSHQRFGYTSLLRSIIRASIPVATVLWLQMYIAGISRAFRRSSMSSFWNLWWKIGDVLSIEQQGTVDAVLENVHTETSFRTDFLWGPRLLSAASPALVQETTWREAKNRDRLHRCLTLIENCRHIAWRLEGHLRLAC